MKDRHAAEDGKPYEIRAFIKYRAMTPRTIESRRQLNLDLRESSYTIYGWLGSAHVESSDWRMPPHEALANLPDWGVPAGLVCEASTLIELSAAEAFIRQYGPLHFELDYHPGRPAYPDGEQQPPISGVMSNEQESLRFGVSSEELLAARAVLRKAWEGDRDALQRIRADALQNLTFDTADASGPAPAAFQWAATDLWNLICILFLKDYTPGRLGKCANPDCQTYFVKPRRTQTVCERQECLRWAQNKSALNWWNRKGRVKRETKVKRRSSSKERKTK